MPIRGTCDACGVRGVTLGRATVCGIETYACAACHGHTADEFDDEPEPETAVTFRDSQSYDGPLTGYRIPYTFGPSKRRRTKRTRK